MMMTRPGIFIVYVANTEIGSTLISFRIYDYDMTIKSNKGHLTRSLNRHN